MRNCHPERTRGILPAVIEPLPARSLAPQPSHGNCCHPGETRRPGLFARPSVTTPVPGRSALGEGTTGHLKSSAPVHSPCGLAAGAIEWLLLTVPHGLESRLVDALRYQEPL